MAKFTNKFHGIVAKFNWQQITEDVNAERYPYMFSVSGVGTVVIWATDIVTASDFIHAQYIDEDIKYLENI
jgi:hypothetical protein